MADMPIGERRHLAPPSVDTGALGWARKHLFSSWGNGITTTPSYYPGLLGAVASHGFVIIAVNDTMVEQPAVDAGLTWLAQQNTAWHVSQVLLGAVVPKPGDRLTDAAGVDYVVQPGLELDHHTQLWRLPVQRA